MSTVNVMWRIMYLTEIFKICGLRQWSDNQNCQDKDLVYVYVVMGKKYAALHMPTCVLKGDFLGKDN